MPGIDGVYIHEAALFNQLLSSQERMTDAILGLLWFCSLRHLCTSSPVSPVFVCCFYPN